MVVRLRLQRFGRTHSPFYRLVAANSKAPRDGRFFEVLGTYNPIASRIRQSKLLISPGSDKADSQGGVKEIRLKTDRLQYWISVGAQPSERVAWILGKFGILPPPPTRFSPQAMQPKTNKKKK
jgi:small subunit ribosomal protein S16